jgi:predicted ATPase/class 3 adenylate cyclase
VEFLGMPSQDNVSTFGSQTEPLPAGQALSPKAHSERRVLTALSYDLVGSTELLEILGIEDFQELQMSFQSQVRHAITANAGQVKEEAGDGGIALFQADLDAKDAASLAIRAGFAIIAACARIGREIRRQDIHVRIGIATSVFIVQENDGTTKSPNITGAAFALATRMQSIANSDTIFVSNETRRLVRRSHVFSDQGLHRLKGFSEPQQVWCAVRHKREVDRFFAFGRMSAPMVNRIADLQLVAELWSGIVKGKGQVLLIKGEAGIGKSRFVHKIRTSTRVNRGNLLLFQCLPGSSRATLHPLLQRFPKKDDADGPQLTASAVSRQFREQGIADAEVISTFSYLLGLQNQNKDLVDAEPDAIRKKANWAVRRSIEMLCAAGPLLAVVEDIHWIDPTTQQLLSEVSRYINDFPVLLVLTSRPTESSDWLEQKNLNVLQLKRLSSEGVQQAVRHFSYANNSPYLPEMLDLIARVSGGVPLFIEEMCQWVSENYQSASEALSKGNLQNQASAFEGVIEARLSALGSVGDIARAASIIGNKFDRELIAELLPEITLDTIGEGLETLSRVGFLIQVRATGAPLYGFRHALVQETIYNTQLKKQKRFLHSKLFMALSRNRELAEWIETSALADHAERAGLIESAVEYYIAAGDESADRSAMVEARQLLEHALQLCAEIEDKHKQDRARLSAITVLGPVLTSTEGPSSEPARKIYDDGVEIARRRPLDEKAQWFPVYWGWWFTGEEVNGERAHALLGELKDVDDPEVQLQSRHCVWAMDFYLGRHVNCIASVESGLPLYDRENRHNNPSLFGGHDTKVCGLAHGGLSFWFRGQPTRAVAMLAEAKSWAQETGHVGTIAHALNNCAMLNCYRRDFAALHSDIASIRELTNTHKLPSLAATAEILEGWCLGLEGQAERGRDMIRSGLAAHKRLQTPEDYPVYCSLLAEVMVLTGEIDAGLELLDPVIAGAEHTGHLYWLSELHHRKAQLMIKKHASPETIVQEFALCLATAFEHGAVSILLTAYDTLVASGLSPSLVAQYRANVEHAKLQADPGVQFFASAPPIDQ